MQVKSPARKMVVPWICLAATLGLFLVYLARLHSANWFGRYGDDAAYFSSAKALAEGRGYIIPSLPGTPAQTKYPVLYPWLLSWVWKVRPSFPSNLGAGVAITAFFTCWFLVAAFDLLRKLKGVGDWPALVIIALVAFEPHFLFISGSILSDLPFMALALTAALLTDKGLRPDGQFALVLLAGVLAGLSVMMRSVGVAVVAGLFFAALLRRRFRQMAIFCLGAAPFLTAAFLSARSSLASGGGLVFATGALPGWQQTLAYDTSYLRMWRVSVPNLHVFTTMLLTNLEQAILAPAVYFLAPTVDVGNGLAANALGVLVGVFTLAGVVRQARNEEWKPIHFVFVFYLAVILVWNYPIMDRFLLLFLPIFFVGVWVEGKHLVAMVLVKLSATEPAGERVLAGALAAGLLSVAGILGWNCLTGYRPELRRISNERAEITQQTLPVYDWIRESTAPEAIFVAADDAALYLYTNRQAVVPIAFSTRYVYTRDHSALAEDLNHITDTAVALHACYWLTSQKDFETLNFPTSEPQDRVAQITATLPVVARNPDGRIRLYDASLLSHREGPACTAGHAGRK